MALFRLLGLLALLYVVWRILRDVKRGTKAPRRQPSRGKAPSQKAAHTPIYAKNPYKILGLQESSSAEEVRRAYQTLVKQYHPDRIADMAPELRELAEQRTQELNAAYESIKRSHTPRNART